MTFGIIVLLLAAVVAVVAVKHAVSGPSAHARAVSRYCASEATVGHTTALNTIITLGDPSYRTTHDGGLFLSYGKVTFAYDWTGELDSSLLSVKDC